MDSVSRKSLALLDEALRWTSLRSIGNSAPARLTIIIPLIGYLIIFNEYLLQYFELSRQLFGNQFSSVQISSRGSAHISFRLLSIYFGLCWIAIASVVYALWCPRETKRHGSAEEYAGGDGKNLSVGQLVEIASKLDQTERKHTKFLQFVGSLEKQPGHHMTSYRKQMEDTEVEGLRNYFEELDKSKYFARFLCGGALALGLTILAFQSVEVFLRVVVLMTRTVFGIPTS